MQTRTAPTGWRPRTVVLLLGAWMALAGNLPLWRTIWALPEVSGPRGLLFSFALAVWIGAALVALLKSGRYTVTRPVYEQHVREVPYTTYRTERECYQVAIPYTTYRPEYQQHVREHRYVTHRTVTEPYQVCVPYTTCRPVYETLPGWSDTTAGLTNWEQLPLNARRYLERVQQLIGAPIDMVSTGPDRVHTILLRHPFRP